MAGSERINHPNLLCLICPLVQKISGNVPIIGMRAEFFFDRDKIDSILFKATDGNDLSFARWMNIERFRLKGNRLELYHSGFLEGDKRQQLSSPSCLLLLRNDPADERNQPG